MIYIGIALLIIALLPTFLSLFWVKRIIKEVGIIPYLIYCVFGASAMLMTILTYVLSPVLSLYSVLAKKKNLPMPFYLLQTHDNDLDGGQLQGYKVTTNPFRLWWQRMCWLCRNPAYGWSAMIIGIKQEDYTQEKTKDSFTNESDEGRLEFTVFTHKTKPKRKRFGIRWHPLWSSKFYTKYWIGWNHYAYGGVYHQVKTMANPFKKREK